MLSFLLFSETAHPDTLRSYQGKKPPQNVTSHVAIRAEAELSLIQRWEVFEIRLRNSYSVKVPRQQKKNFQKKIFVKNFSKKKKGFSFSDPRSEAKYFVTR